MVLSRSAMSYRKRSPQPDNFSDLPHDCLLAICSFLDRESLDNLELVSRELYIASNDKSLRYITREINMMRIEQTNHGYMLCVVPQNPSNTHMTFLFEFDGQLRAVIKKSGEEAWKREIRDVLGDEFMLEFDGFTLANGLRKRAPELLFRVIEKLLLTTSIVDTVIFKRVLINASFLDKYLEACKSMSPRCVRLEKVSHDFTNEGFKSLMKTVLVPSVVSLDFDESGIERFIDERFIEEFALTSSEDRYLRLDSQTTLNNSSLTFSQNSIHSIARFRFFKVPSLCFPTESISDLFQIRLSMPTPDAFWTFGMTRNLIQADFDYSHPFSRQCHFMALHNSCSGTLFKGEIMFSNNNFVHFRCYLFDNPTIRIWFARHKLPVAEWINEQTFAP